jgi:hypothetical protein
VKLGVSGATPDRRASPRGAHLATATPAATGLAAVHALESRRRLTRPKRKPTAEHPGGGRRVGRLMAPSIAIDIHPEGTAARVDVVNTFRCIRRSFHVVSRRFALSNSVFPQVTGPFAPSSIPGSSTTESAGHSHKGARPRGNVKIPDSGAPTPLTISTTSSSGMPAEYRSDNSLAAYVPSTKSIAIQSCPSCAAGPPQTGPPQTSPPRPAGCAAAYPRPATAPAVGPLAQRQPAALSRSPGAAGEAEPIACVVRGSVQMDPVGGK